MDVQLIDFAHPSTYRTFVQRKAGTMPCDGAWPDERVEVFRRWVDSGKAA